MKLKKKQKYPFQKLLKTAKTPKQFENSNKCQAEWVFDTGFRLFSQVLPKYEWPLYITIMAA